MNTHVAALHIQNYLTYHMLHIHVMSNHVIKNRMARLNSRSEAISSITVVNPNLSRLSSIDIHLAATTWSWPLWTKSSATVNIQKCLLFASLSVIYSVNFPFQMPNWPSSPQSGIYRVVRFVRMSTAESPPMTAASST